MDSSQGGRLRDHLLPVEPRDGARPILCEGDKLWKPTDPSALAEVLPEPLQQVPAARLHALLEPVHVKPGEHGPQVTLGSDTVSVDLLGPQQGLWHVPGPAVPAPLEDFRVRPAPPPLLVPAYKPSWSTWTADPPAEPSGPRLTPALRDQILSLLGNIVRSNYGASALFFSIGTTGNNRRYGLQTMDSLRALFEHLGFTLDSRNGCLSTNANGPFWSDFLDLLLNYFFSNSPTTSKVPYQRAQRVLADRFFLEIFPSTYNGKTILCFRFTA